jgi:2-keto-4-pentenoate hydratase/2-oxohepta-3-ene-1,7-dioic acid hydratase in catechol pathway
MKKVRIYRRPEATMPRTGKLTLQVGERWFDLSEYLWHREMPLLLTALCRRDWFGSETFDAWLESARLPETNPITEDDLLLPPILPTEVGKILALGKNFSAHAAEFSEEVPEEPLVFNKLPETLRGHLQEVSPPANYQGRLDHEVELAVILCKTAHRVTRDSAMQCVAGYTVANDLTLRTTQQADRDKKFPWFRGKNFDGACPLGPCFVPVESIDINSLAVTCEVGGEIRQRGNIADLVVDVPAAISYISNHFTLNAGDIILMGTPAGVGPLEDGDRVTCAIEEIGELTTIIRR